MIPIVFLGEPDVAFSAFSEKALSKNQENFEDFETCFYLNVSKFNWLKVIFAKEKETWRDFSHTKTMSG